MTLIRVMIVDDSRFLRSGLTLALEAEADIQVVGEFGEGAPAIAELESLAPQVVLLSVNLPDISGFEACMRILDTAPQTRVIMLSPRLNDEEIATTIMAGAAAYLTKDARSSDLIRTVRANGAGEIFLVAPVAERVLRAQQYSRRMVNVSQLTRREKQVLVLVADGLSNSQIGARLALSPNTVRAHINHIFAKPKISGMAELGVYLVLPGVLDMEDIED